MLESENSTNYGALQSQNARARMGCYGFVIRPSFVTWGRRARQSRLGWKLTPASSAGGIKTPRKPHREFALGITTKVRAVRPAMMPCLRDAAIGPTHDASSVGGPSGQRCCREYYGIVESLVSARRHVDSALCLLALWYLECVQRARSLFGTGTGEQARSESPKGDHV
jgi:hypothetical protein